MTTTHTPDGREIKAGADLRGADLRKVDLFGADLRRAMLCGAILQGADLFGADLQGAKHEGPGGTVASIGNIIEDRWVSIEELAELLRTAPANGRDA